MHLEELTAINGGIIFGWPVKWPVGWPNGWDLPDKESLGTCDPPRMNCVGPVTFPPK